MPPARRPAASGLGALSEGREFPVAWSWLFPEGLNCCISYTVRFLIKGGKSTNSYDGCFLLRILLEWKKSGQKRMNLFLDLITSNLLVLVFFICRKMMRTMNPWEH